MPLGTEVDLGPGHNVLEQQPPIFVPYLLWLRSPISATAELLYKRLPKKLDVS